MGQTATQSYTLIRGNRSGKIVLPPPADKEEGEGGGFSSSPPSDRENSLPHKLTEAGQAKYLSLLLLIRRREKEEASPPLLPQTLRHSDSDTQTLRH